MQHKILIVDDEPANLRILERLFRGEHAVITAESGTAALEILALHDVAVIISDQRMPVITGIEFLKKAAQMRPQTVRIILTGYTDVNALVEAINSGVVYKYVSKPWINEDLRQTVKRALQHHETLKQQHQLGMRAARLESRLKATTDSFARIIAFLLNLKEPHLYAHARRAADFARSIGERLDLSSEEIDQLCRETILHEFAHINIPNQILRATDRTEEENKIFKDNFERALQMLESVPELEDAVSVIRSLHEQFDGNGLPCGLAGDHIPLRARIIAVADAFDEMTSAPENLMPDEAKRRLQSDSAKKFDPEIVRVFCELN